MKKKRRINKKYQYIGIVLIIVIVIAIFLLTRVNTSAGVQYIKDQEALDVQEVQKSLKKLDKEEKMELLKTGKVSPFSLFSDYVFYGDSRVVGFSLYGYLDEGRIFAETGDSITFMENWDEQLKALQPSYIIVSYGANDLVAGYSPEDYKKITIESVKHVQEICPEAEIYINSIIRVTSVAIDSNNLWTNLDAFNTVLEEACKENKWTFVDNNRISNGEANPEIYQNDGIHFQPGFYEVWARNIIEKVLS